MENGTLAMVSKVTLDPKTLNYVSIKQEDLGIQVPLKIYIDANVGTSGMITEIVYWDSQSQKLVAPLYNEKKGINPVTRRYEPSLRGTLTMMRSLKCQFRLYCQIVDMQAQTFLLAMRWALCRQIWRQNKSFI